MAAIIVGASILGGGVLAGCGKPNVTYRRIEINKKKEDPKSSPAAAAVKVPGERRKGLVPYAFMFTGGELKRVVEPGPDAILPGKHYVSIALEEVRIHEANLQRPLVLHIKVEGALPTGDTLTAVLGRAFKESMEGPFIKFDKPIIIDPFVYKGQPLLIDVALTTVAPAAAAQVDAAKKEWGRVRQIDPNEPKRHALDAAPIPTEGSEWIGAQFATKVQANALPLVAGKYVVISHPKPEEIKDKITFDLEKGLVWKDGGEKVQGVSYITFHLNRRTRGPRRDTVVEQQKKTIETAITNGDFDNAKGAIEKLPEFVDKDNTITDSEKEYNKELVKIYQLRIERKQAKKAQDAATLKSKSDDLVKAIDDFKKKFKDMIEASEVNDLNFKLRRYLRERE